MVGDQGALKVTAGSLEWNSCYPYVGFLLTSVLLRETGGAIATQEKLHQCDYPVHHVKQERQYNTQSMSSKKAC
jgi:hypothetical protein